MKCIKDRCKLIAKICVLIVMISVNIPMNLYATSYSQTDFEQIIDGYMQGVIDRKQIIGASVVAVKDGEVILKKGYGYADLEANKNIDEENTLMSIGSVTKLFTAMAVMQLSEEGKVDLNQDISMYLKDVEINNPYDTPITLKSLLTHTAGIAETADHVVSDEVFDKPPVLQEVIKEGMPDIIRRPNELIQYSNYGYALAGYVVECITGTSIEEYITKKILEPLGMNSSAYWINADNMQRLSKSYVGTGTSDDSEQKSGVKGKTHQSIYPHPSGCMSLTTDDMAKFLLSVMKTQQGEEEVFLKQDTMNEMMQPQFTVNPTIPGYGYALYQNYKNKDIIMIDGQVEGFISRLSIFPEENIGFFICYNTNDDSVVRDEFEKQFYDYFNVGLEQEIINIQPDTTTQTTKQEMAEFNGKYVFTQRLLKGTYKCKGLMLKIGVEVVDNDHIRVTTFDTSMNGVYTRMQDYLYVNSENRRAVCLKESKDGNKYIVLNMSTPMQSLEKINDLDVIYEVWIKRGIFIIAGLELLIGLIRKLMHKKAVKPKMFRRLIIMGTLLFGVAYLAAVISGSDTIHLIIRCITVAITLMIAISCIGEIMALIKRNTNSKKDILAACNSIIVILMGGGTILYALFIGLIL